jgi:hypothetical protein
MMNGMESLIGPTAALAQVQRGAKARQVSTHTHDAAPADMFAGLRQIGHADFKSIPANGTWEFPTMTGPGSIASIWLTVAGRLREAVIRRNIPAHRYLWMNIYFDGVETAAVSAPIGHFFGNGTTHYTHFWSKFVGMTSGGYYSYLPMPFAESCRVVMENRHHSKSIPLFYGAIQYYELPQLAPGWGRLHTQYHAKSYLDSGGIHGSLIPNDPHVILEEDGTGKYVGLTMAMFPTHPILSRFKPPYFLFPYLEGNLKVYVDDEVPPPGTANWLEKPVDAPQGSQSVECTGVEDYFLSGWYYAKGPFAALWHGCPIKSTLSGAVSQYRFHEVDAYPWSRRIRMTLTHGEFDQIDCRIESLAYYYKMPAT